MIDVDEKKLMAERIRQLEADADWGQSRGILIFVGVGIILVMIAHRVRETILAYKSQSDDWEHRFLLMCDMLRDCEYKKKSNVSGSINVKFEADKKTRVSYSNMPARVPKIQGRISTGREVPEGWYGEF
jgi:hypothetical protein